MSDSTVCPVNINAAGRRRRLVLGTVTLAVTLLAHFIYRPELYSLIALVELALLSYGWLCAMQAVRGT